MTFLVVALGVALAAAGAVQQEPAGRGRGRGTPPQPQQKQGVEYFAGTWSFTWTGRESPVTAGPRKGTIVFTSAPGENVLQIQTEGTIEDNNAKFTESGTAEWDAARKTVTFKETLANGTTLSGVGDWSSPLAVRYESQPAPPGHRASGSGERTRYSRRSRFPSPRKSRLTMVPSSVWGMDCFRKTEPKT
jgi:hypothetical protein